MELEQDTCLIRSCAVQSACQAVDESSTEESLGTILEDLKTEALAESPKMADPVDVEGSAPEPSHAEDNRGRLSMAITTVFAVVAALW